MHPTASGAAVLWHGEQGHFSEDHQTWLPSCLGCNVVVAEVKICCCLSESRRERVLFLCLTKERLEADEYDEGGNFIHSDNTLHQKRRR